MKLRCWLMWLIAGTVLAGPVGAQPHAFSFAVIANAFQHAPDEAALREAIMETDADNLAFIVGNGLRARTEACSDQIYLRRKAIYETAKNGLILFLSAADWAECRREDGSSAAVERLTRLRDLFFTGEFSFGATRIPLIRQSAVAQFAAYGENMRWEFGPAVFATLNLPANNNHYLAAAGRNSEFEDRLVANRHWLQRVFSIAKWKKLPGIVLFTDANPLGRSQVNRPIDGGRDGFAEIRDQIRKLAAAYSGKVLLIHNAIPESGQDSGDIIWHGNLGSLAVRFSWVKVTVDPNLATLFAADSKPVANSNGSR